jgi:hypothetical protein
MHPTRKSGIISFSSSEYIAMSILFVKLDEIPDNGERIEMLKRR